MKELREKIFKIIVEAGRTDLCGYEINHLIKEYGVTKVQNAISYFKYSKNGQAKVQKALAK